MSIGAAMDCGKFSIRVMTQVCGLFIYLSSVQLLKIALFRVVVADRLLLFIYHIVGDEAKVGKPALLPIFSLVGPCAPLRPGSWSQQRDVVQARHSTEAIIPHFIERMREICEVISFFLINCSSTAFPRKKRFLA